MATLVSQIRTFTVELKYVYFKHKDVLVSDKNVQIKINNLIVSFVSELQVWENNITIQGGIKWRTSKVNSDNFTITPFHFKFARQRGAFSSIFSMNTINWCGLGTALRTTSKITSGAEGCFKRGEKRHHLFRTPIKSLQKKLSRLNLFSRLSVN